MSKELLPVSKKIIKSAVENHKKGIHIKRLMFNILVEKGTYAAYDNTCCPLASTILGTPQNNLGELTAIQNKLHISYSFLWGFVNGFDENKCTPLIFKKTSYKRGYKQGRLVFENLHKKGIC